MPANISCEPEIKIYEFLKNTRQNNPEYYEPVKRILGYIYKTVKKDFFQKQADDFLKIGEKDKGKNVYAAEKNMFQNYVESEEGILNTLIKMLDNNPEYFKYFYSKIEPFLEMSDNGIYSEYGIYKYVFNIYTMLELYNLYPNDFESFKAVVDDLSNFFITSVLNTDRHISYIWGAEKPSFGTKKDIIIALLSISNYKNHPKIREEVKRVLDEINYTYEESLIRQYQFVTTQLSGLYLASNKLKLKGFDVTPQIIDQLEDEIMVNIINSKIHDNGHSDRRRQASFQTVLYTPILLVKERYDFIKERLDLVEDKTEIKGDVLSYIQQIDSDFFEYLGKHTYPKDAFIACMEIVLDSDTYYEVASKLTDLVEAAKIYKEDEMKALELVTELKSSKHKQVIDGVVMAWPENNNINKTEKPVKIIDRMMKLQRTLEHAPNEEFYHERSGSYYSKLTLKGFSERVIMHMNESKARQIRKLEEQRKAEEEALLKQQEEQAKKPKGLGSLFGKKNNN